MSKSNHSTYFTSLSNKLSIHLEYHETAIKLAFKYTYISKPLCRPKSTISCISVEQFVTFDNDLSAAIPVIVILVMFIHVWVFTFVDPYFAKTLSL